MIKVTKVDWIGHKSKTLADQNLIEQVRKVTEQKMHHIYSNGIPDDWHEQCAKFGDVLAERADILLFPTKKTIDEAFQILDGLTNALAILAFVKGGVECFGYHFEGLMDGSGKA